MILLFVLGFDTGCENAATIFFYRRLYCRMFLILIVLSLLAEIGGIITLKVLNSTVSTVVVHGSYAKR
jgi:hypothetical protein